MSHIEHLTYTEEFDACASMIWDLLIDWGGIIDWMPNNYIRSLRLEGEGEGAIRHLSTRDGALLSESLDVIDKDSGYLELSLVNDLPWGLLAYRAKGKLEVISDNKCRLTWQGTFEMPAGGPESDRVVSLLKKSYANMFLGIRRKAIK